MNKLELIQEVKEKNHLTKDQASKVSEIFFGEMAKALVNGERVEIRGLCSFSIKEYKGYSGRNHPFLNAGKN